MAVPAGSPGMGGVDGGWPGVDDSIGVAVVGEEIDLRTESDCAGGIRT